MMFERLKAFFFKPWVTALYFLLLAACFRFLDKPIALHFHILDLEHRRPFLNYLTKLGSGAYSLTLLLLIALFFRYLRPNIVAETRAWFLWFAVLLPSLVCDVIKIGLGRARPVLWFESGQYGFFWLKTSVTYWSMPSGHTTVIMGLVLGLGILFPKWGWPVFLLGLIIAGTRVILTYHYLSDVLLAGYLVLLELTILQYYLKKLPHPGLAARLRYLWA